METEYHDTGFLKQHSYLNLFFLKLRAKMSKYNCIETVCNACLRHPFSFYRASHHLKHDIMQLTMFVSYTLYSTVYYIRHFVCDQGCPINEG